MSAAPDTTRDANWWSLSVVEVPGDIDHHGASSSFQQEERRGQLGPLVVEEVLVPMRFNEFRQHDGDGAIRMPPLELEHMIDDGLYDEPIRRVQHRKGRRRLMRQARGRGCRLIGSHAAMSTAP